MTCPLHNVCIYSQYSVVSRQLTIQSYFFTYFFFISREWCALENCTILYNIIRIEEKTHGLVNILTNFASRKLIDYVSENYVIGYFFRNSKSNQKSLVKYKMYNNVGLQTARGSGGSGYVQKNLSVTNSNFKKPHNKQEFLKELDQMRKNNLPPARKANPEIIQHQRKRQILIHTIKLKEKLKAEGLSAEQIAERVQKAQQILKQKMQKGQMQTRAKQTHVLTQAKQKQYMSLSKAFGLQANHKVGSSFDFQGIKNEKLKRMEQKRIKQQQKFKCPHQQCGKSYDMKQLLDRHLKYKHPQTYKSIEQERQKERRQRNEKRKALKAQQQQDYKAKRQQKYRGYDRAENENWRQKYRSDKRSGSGQRKRSYSKQKQSPKRQKVVQRKGSEQKRELSLQKDNKEVQLRKGTECVRKRKQRDERIKKSSDRASEKSSSRSRKRRVSSSSSSSFSSSSGSDSE